MALFGRHYDLVEQVPCLIVDGEVKRIRWGGMPGGVVGYRIGVRGGCVSRDSRIQRGRVAGDRRRAGVECNRCGEER